MNITDAIEVGLGLGSNIGDKAGHIARAVAILADAGILRDIRRSSLYRTAPWGPVEQDWYVNACVLGRTSLAPEALLSRIKAVEVSLGRTETVRWGPRVIDIDILFYGELNLDVPDLTLPHRELLNRAFVLVPLADLCPKRRIGTITVAEAVSRLDATGVERLSG